MIQSAVIRMPPPEASTTLTLKVLVAVNPPASVTVIVIVVLPVCDPLGTRVIVRFVPDPPTDIPEAGNNAAFEDDAEMLNAPADVSRSETTNARLETGVPVGTT